MVKKNQMNKNSILVFFHCRSNTGYAIAPIEKAFFKVAFNCVSDYQKIHFAYTSLENGFPETLPNDFTNIIEFNAANAEDDKLQFIKDYIKKNHITIALGFDQPVARPAFKIMRRAGVKKLISYWGAPMSSINHGLKLWLKRMQVYMTLYKPDHYIFESNAMAESAIYGRGIAKKNVSVIYMGVDTDAFKPLNKKSYYAYQEFGIPVNRFIIFYSGHMEERKGVKIIVRAAVELINKRKREDVHFLLLGNKYSEEKNFYPLFEQTNAADHITFGGYRNDIKEILPSCYLGTIASTGWDSFTMSAIEMAACGLPLIASNLQGLAETVENNVTGFLFEKGNHIELANRIEFLLDNPELRKNMSTKSRNRVLSKHRAEEHICKLTKLLMQFM